MYGTKVMALSQTTLKRYFALLEATFLVQLLRPWARSLRQRAIQIPKVYLNDTGLLAHLLGTTMDRLKGAGSQAVACQIIRRRAKAADIKNRIENHTFRATGIAAYLNKGGKLEIAQ